MQYLGGKSRLARKIVEAIHPERFPFVWEPFCGGFAVTAELGRVCRNSVVLASDIHPGLIALGRALASGWLPTELGRALTDDEHRLAKSLDDDNPYKALVGFGCSFGGMWFHTNAKSSGRSHHDGTVRSLRSAAPKLHDVGFARVDFLQELPTESRGLVVYCDPPYHGTFGYSAVQPFDHGLFWARCTQWARMGAKVFVSEFGHPDNVAVSLVAEFPRRVQVNKTSNSVICVDRLYEVLP